jgi:hypothetical protein
MELQEIKNKINKMNELKKQYTFRNDQLVIRRNHLLAEIETKEKILKLNELKRSRDEAANNAHGKKKKTILS